MLEWIISEASLESPKKSEEKRLVYAASKTLSGEDVLAALFIDRDE